MGRVMTLCKAAISSVFFAQSWNKIVSGVCVWSSWKIKFHLEWIYQETEDQPRKLIRMVWLIKASLCGDTHSCWTKYCKSEFPNILVENLVFH